MSSVSLSGSQNNPNGGYPVTRSSSSTSNIQQRTHSLLPKLPNVMSSSSSPAPRGGKVASLRPRKRSLPKIATHSLSQQNSSSQSSSQEASLSIPPSPFDFSRSKVKESSEKRFREEKGEESSSLSRSTSQTLTRSASNSLIQRINNNTEMTALMSLQEVYPFLVKYGDKITVLNLSNLDKNVINKSAELNSFFVKISNLNNLASLRAIELRGLLGTPGEQSGMAFTKIFKATLNLEKFIYSGNNDDPEFITPMIHGIKYLTKLTHLILEEIEAQDLDILVTLFPELFYLKVLHLAFSSKIHVKVLAQQLPWLPNLEELFLKNNEKDEVMSVSNLPMRLRYIPKLRQFGLHGFQMNEDDLLAFGKVLKVSKDLSTVVFRNCALTPAMLQVLLGELQGHPHIKKIDFSENDLGISEEDPTQNQDDDFQKNDVSSIALAALIPTLPNLEEVICSHSGLFNTTELERQCHLHPKTPKLKIN